jgi:hypothetical protein
MTETRGEPAVVRQLPGLQTWLAPHFVRLEGDDLVFDWDEDPRVPERQMTVEPRMLSQFANLADSPPSRFVDYAARWGALGLQNGRPGTWVRVEREAIADWRGYAREARAMLQIGEAIHNDEAPPPEAVAVLALADPKVKWHDRSTVVSRSVRAPYDGYVVSAGPSERDSSNVIVIDHGNLRTVHKKLATLNVAADQKVEAGQVIGLVDKKDSTPQARHEFQVFVAGDEIDPAPYLAQVFSRLPATDPWDAKPNLAQHVNRWLKLGGIALELSWGRRDESPTYGVYAPGLFGAIALLVAGTINRSAEQAWCSNCRTLYTPTRKPAKGRRNYCLDPACKKASRRDAQRDHKARKAGGSETTH